MSIGIVYSILGLVVICSCAAEYLGVRALSASFVRKQKWLAAVPVVACGLAFAAFGNAVAVTDFFVLIAALFAGRLLGRNIGSTGALVTMLVVASIADLISSRAGVSRLLVNQAQRAHGVTALQFLAVCVTIRQKLVPIIGVADLMFFVACVSVTRRLRWPEVWTFSVPLVGLLAALVVGLFAGFTPALPFLAAAVSIYAYASRLPRQAPCHG